MVENKGFFLSYLFGYKGKSKTQKSKRKTENDVTLLLFGPKVLWISHINCYITFIG